MSTLYYESSIAHHGIKGQKWGVRRYQNPDGSLTAKGRSRYDDTNDKKAKRRQESYERGKKLAEEGATLTKLEDKIKTHNKKKGIPNLILAYLSALGIGAAGIASAVATPAAACVIIPATFAGFVGVPLGIGAITAKKNKSYSRDYNDLNEYLGTHYKKNDIKSAVCTTNGKYAYDSMNSARQTNMSIVNNQIMNDTMLASKRLASFTMTNGINPFMFG